ncbi:MAG: TetR/AcrR family transcriptional regulator [Kofleriaceae bacterium]
MVAAKNPMTAHFARAGILAAAQKVFTQHGIAAARVEDILVAAKLARRTFYKYFASKDEVLAALYEVWTGELLKAIDAARAHKPGIPLAGIRAGIDIFFGFYRGPRALRELVELAMRSDSLLAGRRRWLREQIVTLIDESIHALDGRRLDPLVYHGLLSALEGIALELHEPSAAEIERARKVTHALVDQALGLPKPTALPHR